MDILTIGGFFNLVATAPFVDSGRVRGITMERLHADFTAGGKLTPAGRKVTVFAPKPSLHGRAAPAALLEEKP